MTDRPRALVVAARPPLPIRGGVDLRILQHLNVIGRAGWEVHLFGIDPTSVVDGTGNERVATCHLASDESVTLVQGPEQAGRFEWIGTGDNPFAAAATEVNRGELTDLLRSLRPDLVVVSGHQASALLDTAAAHGAPLVLDLHDVLADLIAGQGQLHPDHRALDLVHRRAAETADRVEHSLMERADQVWACSEGDAARLARGTTTPLAVVPNTVDLHQFPTPHPASEPRVVFTAGFGYLPNRQAGLELASAIETLAGVHLDLVGTDGHEALASVADRRDVTVTGWVPDVRPYLQRAWLAAMPIRAGSGTRLKVAEAAGAWLPILATAKAVEGTGMEPGVHYLLAEEPTDLAAGIRRLVDDAELRGHLATAARLLAQENLSWDAAGRAVAAALRDLIGPGTVPR